MRSVLPVRSAARRSFSSALALALSSSLFRPYAVPPAQAATLAASGPAVDQIGLDGRLILDGARKPTVDVVASPPTVTSRCFLDVSIGGASAGRIVVDLYGELCPRAAENFRALCTGERGFGYAGSSFYKVVDGFTMQAGELESGSRSIFGSTFAHDNYSIKHSTAGLLSFANTGVGGATSESDSRFLIQLVDDAGFLDGRYEAFGRVSEGMAVVRAIERVSVKPPKNAPIERVGIAAAGQLRVRA